MSMYINSIDSDILQILTRVTEHESYYWRRQIFFSF